MERYLSRVANVLALADSKKITERKTFLQDMLDIFSDEEYVASINAISHTKLDGPTSWNEIMLTVHRVILSEAEKPPSKAQRTNTTAHVRSSCGTVMTKTISLATSTRTMLLNCADLMAVIFQILSKQIYETFHAAYINILVNHVLTNKLYRMEINGEQWSKILTLSMKIYKNSSDYFKSVVLNTARLAVQYGCLQSHLLFEVKKILPFLEQIFRDTETDKGMMLKPVYELMYAVCQQIGTESRIALCELSEKCLPLIVALEGCSEKYNMMLLFVQIHHPSGVDANDEAAYACNWDLWKSIVRGMQANIIRDMKPEKVSPCLLKLACEVYRQIMLDTSYVKEEFPSTADEEYTQPSKRRRLSMAIQKPIDMLTDVNLEKAWPSIQILTVLLRKYPDCLKSSDYVEFLRSVTGFVTASLNKENVMDSLCELCTVLVSAEKGYINEIERNESIGACWEKIWDTMLRALSMNQNEVLGHELLQSIIQYRNVLNPTAFLRLYLTNAIRWSSSSVETLLNFCNYVPLPSELSNVGGASTKPEASVRESLLRWTLEIPSSKLSAQIPSVSLANLLTALTIKSSHKRGFREVEDFHDSPIRRKIAVLRAFERDLFDDPEAKALNDIERCHLALEFRRNLFDEPDEPKTTETKVRTVCVPAILEMLVSILTDSLGNHSADEDVGVFIKKITIVAKLLSNYAEFNVRADEQISKLYILFTQSFKKITAALTTMSTMKCPYLVPIVEALEVLYGTRYHWKVANMIVELSSMDFIAFIYELIPDESDDPVNDENSQRFYANPRKSLDRKGSGSSGELSDSDRVKNSAHRVLTYYCCAWIGEDISISQTRVLRNMMKIDIYEATSTANLRRALTLLKAFGSSDKQLSTSDDCLDISTTFLKQLYASRRKDETAVRGVLNVLPHYVKAAMKLRRSVDELSTILCAIHKQLIDETPIFGSLVQADFVKCLTEIIRLDPQLKWKLRSSADPSPITDVILGYVNSPFYMVRLEVVRAVYVLFSSRRIEVPWKLKFFEKIETSLANLFVIDDLPEGNERADETLTRKITAVHVFAAIIRANEFLQGRALFGVIEMSKVKNVETKTLKKALLSITNKEGEQRRLVEINLHYLLDRWFESKYTLAHFPWALADCESQEDFSRKYIETLLMIKLKRREFDDIYILCNNLDVEFGRTIENCFPSITALLLSMKNGDLLDESYGSRMYDRLRSNSDEFRGLRNFDDLLIEKLPEVIVELVKRIHDQEHFCALFEIRVFLPKLNPQNIDTDTANRCFRCLEDDLRVNGASIIEYMIIREPSSLQKILLTLNCNIHEVNGADYRLEAFHQYAYFCRTVIEELSSPYFDPMAFYVVRDLTHALLALIKEETKPLSEMACTYFQLFLKNALPARSAEIKQVLSFTVSSLITIVKSAKVSGAMPILRFLIVDQRTVLGDAIKKLDSFPNEESFEEIKQVHNGLKYEANREDLFSLEDEIEHFLNAVHDKTLSCSLAGLSHVRNQLSTRKTQLRAMYSNLEKLRGFAEDCATSTLHRLVYRLVQLTKSSDADVSLEAVKCLGELGPADLTTMILRPENGYRRESIDDEIPMLTLQVVSRLADHLIENNVQLKRASADALYEVFATKWGQKLFTKKSLGQEFGRIYDHVYPFGTAKASRTAEIRIDRGYWERCIDPSDDLWMPASYDSYPKWITDITCKLLDCLVNFYTKSLKPVCRLSVEFCEALLPRLVNLIIRTEERLVGDVFVVINRFFRFISESSSDMDQTTITPDCSAKRDVARSYECVRCMLNVVNFMRIQSVDNAPLALDYLLIAKAAQYCSAYFTSVLYAELWCESVLRDSGLLMDKVPGSWMSAIDCICESKPESGKLLQDIVREAYLHIGDPDSIYGCGLSHLTDPSFRTQHYIHLRQWDKVMLAQDVDMTCGSTATRGMLNALQQSGLQYLLGRMINTVNKETENVDDFMYEAAWRLADWNIVDSHRVADCTTDASANPQSVRSEDYHASHYRALKCLCDGDVASLKSALHSGRASIVKSLRNMSLECNQTVYPILSKLQLLREIEEFATTATEDYDALFDAWYQQGFSDTHDFQYVESILSQRLVMYSMRKSGSALLTMSRALIHTHLEIAEIAEKQGYFPIAARSLGTLTKMNGLPDGARDQLTYQEAVLAWKRSDQDVGRYLLRNLIKKPSLKPSLRASTLRVYGNWMAETKSENPQAIIEKYYEESIRTSIGIAKPSSSDVKNLTDAQADLAQFADAQYQQIIEFMKSPQYESLVECSKLQNDTRSGRAASGKGTEEMKAMITYQKQMTNDAAELEDIKREKEMYLVLSARYYLSTLQNGNGHDLLIFRLVSLWLDNMFCRELNDVLDGNLQRVASHKFVTLLPQLAPHMSNEINPFTSKINELMERCARQHPHHTVPVLLALKNTYKDQEYQSAEKGTQKRGEKKAAEGRIVMAETLIQKLTDSMIRPIISEMCQLSSALIQLAYYAVSDSQARKVNTPHRIPRDQAVTRVRNYEHICVPTITMDVRPNGNYNDVIGIREYGTSFEIPGGVCAPKKIICVGTDGIPRKQLVKGRDDLRQDAVMQQVCTVMNSMLRASKETKRRKLHIRTYKIVPLSQRSGVLEWCENTLPISSVLCDSPGKLGLHSKYYPDDWSVIKCRTKLRDVDKSSSDVKLRVFLECCKNLHPAFHHFFMEKYPSAETWFERRLAFTRSVATTSMVGYMLGLGDRHFSNILIDQTTAEVIHIDFGIAFAQGKVLPIPETVPFRLTRDMETAMGICGVEGVMRRSCEETVAVLRDRRKTLITLLQVLLYDPLFSWAITPVKSDESCIGSRYGERTGNQIGDATCSKKTNKIAERALLRIEQKLQGTEDGLVSSISGQVERLIQQARDPANLCRLYSGWQAYL